jgi:hypothetical protein
VYWESGLQGIGELGLGIWLQGREGGRGKGGIGLSVSVRFGGAG